MKKVSKHRFYLEYWVNFLSETVVETGPIVDQNVRERACLDACLDACLNAASMSLDAMIPGLSSFCAIGA